MPASLTNLLERLPIETLVALKTRMEQEGMWVECDERLGVAVATNISLIAMKGQEYERFELCSTLLSTIGDHPYAIAVALSNSSMRPVMQNVLEKQFRYDERDAKDLVGLVGLRLIGQ